MKDFTAKVYDRRGDLIKTNNIFKGEYGPVKKNTNSYDRTRTNGLKISKRVINSSQYQQFFTNRAINYWNILPTVNVKSTNVFENYIDKIFKELY